MYTGKPSIHACVLLGLEEATFPSLGSELIAFCNRESSSIGFLRRTAVRKAGAPADVKSTSDPVLASERYQRAVERRSHMATAPSLPKQPRPMVRRDKDCHEPKPTRSRCHVGRSHEAAVEGCQCVIFEEYCSAETFVFPTFRLAKYGDVTTRRISVTRPSMTFFFQGCSSSGRKFVIWQDPSVMTSALSTTRWRRNITKRLFPRNTDSVFCALTYEEKLD